MAKRQKYIGIKRNDTQAGKTALILSVISAAAFVVGMSISFMSDDGTGHLVGALGLGGFLIALYGCIYAIKNLSKKNQSHGFMYGGAITNGIMLLIWSAICLVGIK